MKHIYKYILCLFIIISLNSCSNSITEFTDDPEKIEKPRTIYRDFSIEENSSFAYSLNINLDINVTDAVMMRFSDTGSFSSSWVPYSESYNFLNSSKTTSLVVNAEFLLDDDTTVPLSDSITYINKIFDKESTGFTGFGNSFSSSNDGKKIALSYNDSDSFSIYNWDESLNEWQNSLYSESFVSTASEYGKSVSLSGDGSILAVGCPEDGTGGAVYIYDTSSGEALFTKKLNSPEIYSDDLFGYRVKLSDNGNYLLASAPGYKTGVSDLNSGALYVIKISDESFIKITPPATETRYDRFGINIYADSVLSNILVSSTSLNTDTDETVFLYSCNLASSTFIKLFKKTDSSTSNLYSFGSSFSINSTGDTIAIGEPDHNQQGAVHIYKKSSGVFPSTEDATINITGLSSSAKFGSSVAFTTDNKIYIGAYGVNSVYEYSIDALNFTMENTITPADLNTGDNFGSTILITSDQNKLVVNSTKNNDGALYIFDR